MLHEPNQSSASADGLKPEPLSNEILKLKVDDLFQEIEQLKLRLERLEGQPAYPIVSRGQGRDRARGGRP
jgi:hypothetical protein